MQNYPQIDALYSIRESLGRVKTATPDQISRACVEIYGNITSLSDILVDYELKYKSAESERKREFSRVKDEAEGNLAHKEAVAYEHVKDLLNQEHELLATFHRLKYIREDFSSFATSLQSRLRVISDEKIKSGKNYQT